MSEETPNPEKGVIAYIFSNDRETAAARLLPLLRMFHEGVYENTVGIAEGRNRETGKIETYLVGITHDEENNSTTCLPIAKVLNEEAIAEIQLPDSYGGWIELDEQWKEIDEPITH